MSDEPSKNFWSSVAEALLGALAKATPPARNPADPAERMEVVREQRKETGGELKFRVSGGATGQPPMDRVERQRRYAARAARAKPPKT